MSDPFDLVGKGDLDLLRATLAAAPALAVARDASGASLLAWAFYTGRPEAVPVIRPHVDRLDPYDAIIIDDIDALRQALAEGWDGNARSADGFTPLALSAFFARPAIFDLLLPATRDVNERATNGQQVAAIHAATAQRQTAMVEKLLRAGADPDLVQADGFTALHAAAMHGDAQIAGLLVLFGADVAVKSAQGLDAAEIARANGHGWLAARLEH